MKKPGRFLSFTLTFKVLYKSQLHSKVGTGRTVHSLKESDWQ